MCSSSRESRICAAMQVPPILVGAKVGLDRSTFTNYQEARKQLWEEAIFSLQGVGQYAADSANTLDLPPVMGTTLYAAFFIVLFRLTIV